MPRNALHPKLSQEADGQDGESPHRRQVVPYFSGPLNDTLTGACVPTRERKFLYVFPECLHM